ncbi:MAG: U32 family peptidase [Lachnospiraceae bacterium]|nr:U32 family peptidase [Lachnospiraceae bacterium]
MRNDNGTSSRSEQQPHAVRPELLAPGGSFEGICAAVNAGADAVYAAGTMFGARAYADNPEEDMLLKAIDYCHLHGAKLYMTVNTLLKERELEENLTTFLRPYYEQGVDAVLVQDPGTLCLIRERFPDLPLHASTQMSVQSPDGARLAAALGISRIVPARELTLPEIRQIYEETGMEIECFIHGALCYSYSGQCLMSSLIGGRSGNRGRCAQPCRKRYTLSEGKGRLLSDPAAPYLLSLKDICALQVLPELIDAGVASFKIEGRMKRAEYAAGVTAVYRKYIDLYMQQGMAGYRVDEADIRILQDLYNRGGFSSGYYHVTHTPKMMVMDRPNHAGTLAAVYSAAPGKGSAAGGRNRQAARSAAGRNRSAAGSAVAGAFTAQEALYPGDMLEAMPVVPHEGRHIPACA